ncbi:MAG TPA: glycosyltransferase family 4 protein [Gaiellales bacterium]
MTRSRTGVVQVADIDLAYPDARRVHVTEIARGLVAAGCSVELVSRGGDPAIPGVRYTQAAPSDAGKAARLLRVNGIGLLRLAARRRTARSLYVRYDWGVLPVIAAGRALGYRVVLEVNALTSVDIAPGQRLALGRRVTEGVKRAAVGVAWRSAYRLLPVTEHLRDRLVGEFGVPPERVEILPNGADAELFAPRDRAAAIAELSLDPADEHILFVGLLAWWNDFPTVVEAFAQVVAQRPHALLLFVGDGDQRDAIEQAAREHGVAGRVRFAGFVDDRALVATYVAAARVCLSPGSAALAIGRPMKLAEYLAAGRAVVGSAIPGISELLAETGGGVTVPAHDPSAMAEALRDLLADPVAADALGLSARPAIVERYSWRAIASRVAAIFQ